MAALVVGYVTEKDVSKSATGTSILLSLDSSTVNPHGLRKMKWSKAVTKVCMDLIGRQVRYLLLLLQSFSGLGGTLHTDSSQCA